MGKLKKYIQQDHWWFRGRRKLVKSAIKPVMEKEKNWLDIGAGYGSMLEVIKEFAFNIELLEPYDDAYEYIKGKADRVYKMDFPSGLPENIYDVVSLFDVLEHMEDDYSALKVIYDNLLKDGGILIITVPAYMWMWSSFDERSGHYRRYNRDSLTQVLEKSGFKVKRLTMFISLLFPLAVFVRFLNKARAVKSESELKIPKKIINNFFTKAVYFESYLIKKGVNLPFGLSLLAIAQKA